MAFYYSFSQRFIRQTRRAKMLEIAIILLFLAFILLAAWFVWLRIVPAESSLAPSTSEIEKSSFAPETKTFQNEYFSFVTTDKWQAVAAESRPGVYVYRGFNSTLVEQDLTIYVNQTSAIPKVSRVQPVTISGGKLNLEGSISDHCGKQIKGTKQPVVTKLSTVELLCDTDGTIYSVLVGQADGDGVLQMPRPGGQTATYTFVYHDLTATPLGRDLSKILRSFETR